MSICRTDTGQWRPVCSDSWNSSWSEQACRQLGMAGDKETGATVDMGIGDQEFWYKDETMPLGTHPIQFSEKIGNMHCQSRAKVEVKCEHFGKLTT